MSIGAKVAQPGDDQMSRLPMEQIRQSLRVFGQDANRRRLEYLDARYLGDPYALDEDLLEWEDEGDLQKVVPVWDRKPGVLTCDARTIIERALSMLVGAGRFPALAIQADGVEHEKATKEVQRLMRLVGFKSLVQSAARAGMHQGSTCAAFYVPRQGKFYRRAYLAKECTPLFGWDDPELAAKHGIDEDDLVSLEIRRIVDKVDDDGEVKWYLWRRILTPTEIIEFKPIEADGDLDQMLKDQQRDTKKSVVHKLGFVPAVWIKTIELDDTPWGGSLLDGLESLFAGIDYMESMRNRACIYHGDPAFTPADAASAALVTGREIPKGATRFLPFPAKFVEMLGSGQDQQAKWVADARRQIAQVTQVYVHDQSQTTGALSGVAMEQLHAPTVGLIDELRGPYGEGIVLLAEKVYRCATAKGAARVPWSEGMEVVLSWPPIFPPNAKDAMEAAQAVAVAVAAGVISRRTALEYLKPYLRIESTDNEADQVRKEEEERAEYMLDAALAKGANPGATLGGNRGGGGAGGGQPKKSQDNNAR